MIEGIVAIVGRPNVGKSTLFNRLTRTESAMVDDRPGVTRDRLYGTATYERGGEDGFIVIDTGGFERDVGTGRDFPPHIIWQQTEAAIKEADVVVLVMDARAGLSPADVELARILKTMAKPVIALVNKIDGREQEPQALEFHALQAMQQVIPASAAHNRGVFELMSAVNEELKVVTRHRIKHAAEDAIKIALIGRPNAGKSSILNRLVGEPRALVSEIAGTTRDPIDTPFTYGKQNFVLIDTAGIRRKSRIADRLETMSVVRSLGAIERADIIVFVIAADEGLTDQDARLIQLAASRYKPVLLVVNKWDLVKDKDTHSAREWETAIRAKMQDVAFLPIMFASCTENQRVHKIMAEVADLTDAYTRRIPTSKLNEVLEGSVRSHTPALMNRNNKRVKFYYATQVRTSPPTIVVMCNVANEIQTAYKRYLAHRFRAELGFEKIPLNVIYRGKPEREERSGAH